MFHRLITPLESTSFFLFGARGTGKTTFLKSFFETRKAAFIDLLKIEDEEKFSRNPNELENLAKGLPEETKWIVIDEVQKIPKLLDAVHLLIEGTDKKFALTGSSSRKLKRGAANLLAGRAFMNKLHPLTLLELNNQVPFIDLIKWGSLPKIFNFTTDQEKQEFLKTYAHTYLREEIASEQLVRKLEPFRNFLEIAAQSNGQIINAAKIGRDCGANLKTVQEYFTILEDTMMGFMPPAWSYSVRKRQRTQPKFYFFDSGIKRALDRTVSQEIYEGSYAFGNSFEHLIVLELFRLNDYFRRDFRFSYFRSSNGLEIDLVIDRPGMPVALLEIKSGSHIKEEDCSPVNQILKDIPGASGFCVSRDGTRKKYGNVLCISYKEMALELGLI